MPTRPLRRTIACSIGFAFVLAGCTGTARSGGGTPSRARSLPRPGPALHLRLRIAPAPFVLPAPVQREVAVSDGGSVYLAGGLDVAGQSVNGVFSLDPATGRVRQVGAVPSPFHDGAGAVLGHRLVVFGGGSVAGTDNVQSFDLRTHGAGVIGHLPHPVSDLMSATVGGTVYLIGGYDGSSPLPAIYSTRDGVRFRLVATLPVGLRYPSVAAVGDRIVIAGGTSSSSGAVSTVYSLDTRDRRISLLGHLPKPVTQAAAVVLDGRVYVIGGEDSSGSAVASVTRIDPVTRAIRAERPLARPVADAAVASTRTGSWLFGGLRGVAVPQVLEATLVPT